MFRYSLNRFVPGQMMVEALTLANYQKFFSDSFYQEVLGTTLWVVSASPPSCACWRLPGGLRAGAPRRAEVGSRACSSSSSCRCSWAMRCAPPPGW